MKDSLKAVINATTSFTQSAERVYEWMMANRLAVSSDYALIAALEQLHAWKNREEGIYPIDIITSLAKWIHEQESDLNIKYLHPAHPAFDLKTKESLQKGLTIVCSQRPVPGDLLWESLSIGNGRYWASGDLTEFKDTWLKLDASIVHLRTNDEVECLIQLECKKRGMDFEDMISRIPLPRLAKAMNYFYIYHEESVAR